jgi:hypothetical protein
MLLFLEVLAECVEFVLRHDGAKRGKQDRVLARFVWPVHPRELAQRVLQ